MKHTWTVTVYLVLIFVCAQIVGVAVIDQYVNIRATKETGKTVINEEQYALITPPQVQNESTTWIFILGAVLVGTVLVLIIIKFQQRNLWKVWFFLSVLVCLFMALYPFVNRFLARLELPGAILATGVVALLFTVYKILRPNIFIHNLTEVFIYGGLAALMVPIINVTSATLLLIGISLYDMFAVWKSKHMVTMAKFQTNAKVFAGLLIPYKRPKHAIEVPKGTPGAEEAKSAILGGGDIAFPLLFSGVIMKTTASYAAPLIITFFAAVALFGLLLKGETNKFYPAMPFISIGCFVGFFVVWLLGMM